MTHQEYLDWCKDISERMKKADFLYEYHFTNADRIRAMTDEELASVITDDWCEIVCSGTYLCNGGNCEQQVLKWLKEEV